MPQDHFSMPFVNCTCTAELLSVNCRLANASSNKNISSSTRLDSYCSYFLFPLLLLLLVASPRVIKKGRRVQLRPNYYIQFTPSTLESFATTNYEKGLFSLFYLFSRLHRDHELAKASALISTNI